MEKCKNESCKSLKHQLSCFIIAMRHPSISLRNETLSTLIPPEQKSVQFSACDPAESDKPLQGSTITGNWELGNQKPNHFGTEGQPFVRVDAAKENLGKSKQSRTTQKCSDNPTSPDRTRPILHPTFPFWPVTSTQLLVLVRFPGRGDWVVELSNNPQPADARKL